MTDIQEERGNKHKELCKTAIYWLYKRGCSIFANEVQTWNGIADALGIITRDGLEGKETIYYIEAKTSRSDLLSPKQKACCLRTTAEFSDIYPNNNIDFFYFIIADGIKFENSLYPGWGIINKDGKVIRKAKHMEKNKDSKDSIDLVVDIAHILVYKTFGKMYLS